MKMKEIGLRGARVPSAPHLGSASDIGCVPAVNLVFAVRSGSLYTRYFRFQIEITSENF